MSVEPSLICWARELANQAESSIVSCPLHRVTHNNFYIWRLGCGET